MRSNALVEFAKSGSRPRATARSNNPGLGELPENPLEHGGSRQKWCGADHLHRTSESGTLDALLIYGKGTTENVPAHILRKIARDMNHAPE